MGRLSFRFVFLILLFLCNLGAKTPAFAHIDPSYKLIPGMPFVFFDLEDIFNQRWVSSYLRGRPVIILTGHRYKRYEILQWAEALKRDFGMPGYVHLLWVVNLSRYPTFTSRQTIVRQWRSFLPPIPLLLDWHRTIGNALQIDYDVPNIIAIDSFGRLAFHDIHTFSPEVYMAVAGKIQALLAVSPNGKAQTQLGGKKGLGSGNRGF
ncbi:hypothetical protein HYY75_05545, partial [bacterium]|nr:hypothetical protein [bacterium]